MLTSLPSTRRWMWPSSPWMRVVVWLMILAPARPRRSSAPSLTVWPLRGVTMVSLAGLLGRGAAGAAAVPTRAGGEAEHGHGQQGGRPDPAANGGDMVPGTRPGGRPDSALAVGEPGSGKVHGGSSIR